MFDSFFRGFRMIWASIKMGWSDKRLLLPSILTVFTNILFGCIFFLNEIKQLAKQGGATAASITHGGHAGHGLMSGMPPVSGKAALHHMQGMNGFNLTGINGPLDQSGVGAMPGWESVSGLFTSDNAIVVASLMMLWWLTNRFLEGVTTALVYSHLTEGKGSGKFSDACNAVISSLPAIVMLGLATLIFKKLAAWLRNKGGGGIFGAGFGVLSSIVEVFWTLAGHLILPAIVIEGCSFWGALKRADKIASGNLLTIGIGEVGVDIICRLFTWLTYLGGILSFAGLYYWQPAAFFTPTTALLGFFWLCTVVGITALSIYIRSAFYTCLYVWAIEAEAVEESERIKVQAPAPLAQALA